jgi:hypothetical protein
VSDALTVDPQHRVPPEPKRAARRFVLATTVVALLIGAVIVAVVRAEDDGHPDLPRGLATASRPLPTIVATADPRAAIDLLLLRRSRALLDHDRNSFLATVDPRRPRFRRAQRAMFDNLQRVHFASWSYDVGPESSRPKPPRLARYHAPTWVPSFVALHYRLAGFDVHPTDRRQYPTFVKRDGRWYLGSLSDFAASGKVSATDLWDYAPVHVIRRPDVLVLGPASELSTMAAVADVVTASIPKVTAVWGRNWARKAVVLVPSTQREMGLIDSDRDDLSQIAALTSAEVRQANGHPAPVGDRITINPANWPMLGPIGAAVVLTHELTHVATRAATGTQTPKWLSEGFAEYVGFRTAPVSVGLAAAQLAHRAQAGLVPSRLPGNHAFRGSATNLGAQYQAAWLACRYVADHYGQSTLVRFYRAVGTSRHDGAIAVRDAMRRVLQTTLPQFDAAWRAYIRAELG